MKLSNVVPWGRSFEEYRKMFSLSDKDLKNRILGCGDGPASFNSELTSLGGTVNSVDPIYEFDNLSLKARITEVYDDVMDQMLINKDKYIWDDIKSVEDLGRVRMNAMNVFSSDYEAGKKEGRYIFGKLPVLQYEDNSFDLALCSHYLFLYSDLVSREDHVKSIIEMCRVAGEVRIYPLTSLSGEISNHLPEVISCLERKGLVCELVPVSYRFQNGATQMLCVKAID